MLFTCDKTTKLYEDDCYYGDKDKRNEEWLELQEKEINYEEEKEKIVKWSPILMSWEKEDQILNVYKGKELIFSHRKKKF